MDMLKTRTPLIETYLQDLRFAITSPNTADFGAPFWADSTSYTRSNTTLWVFRG